MKHAGNWKFIILIGIPFILASCGGRFIDWGKCQFNQGCNLPNNFDCVQDYIRSVRIYDEFVTMGIFNALWLSPAVQEASLDLKSVKFNMSDSQIDASMKAIKGDTQKFVSFYILAYQPRWLGSIFGKKDSHWTMLLNIDGVKYEPLEVKLLEAEDVDPTYLGYFGDRLTRHKSIFYVRFPATKPGGESLFTEDTDEFTICFRALKKQVALGWKLCNGPEQILHPDIACGAACNESGTISCGDCKLCTARDECEECDWLAS